jgi:DNA-binding CsgD family transcriptional regulator
VSQPLTQRETQVVEFFNLGMTDKQIGEALGIALGTVKIHVKSAREKGHVNYRLLTKRFIGTQGIIEVVLGHALNPGELLREMQGLSKVESHSEAQMDVYDWVRRVCPGTTDDQVERAKERDACQQRKSSSTTSIASTTKEETLPSGS